MKCNDEDDFDAVKRMTWSVGEDFEEGEPVELWRMDAQRPPRLCAGYARAGKVLKVRLARPDPEALTRHVVEMRSHASRKFKDFGSKLDGVVLDLEENVEIGWSREPEVHYDHVVAGEGAGGAAWKCKSRPTSISRHKGGCN